MSVKVNWRPLRKVVAGFLTGLTSTGVVAFLAESGVTLDAGWAALIVAGASTLAGYVTPEKKA